MLSTASARKAVIAERRTKAITLRLAGADYDTIAARLGYSGRAAACKDITRALAVAMADLGRSADELRELELTRLDRLQAAAWAAAVGGDLRAIDTVLRVVDRRCRLLGLDAPVRAEVLTISDVDREIRELSQRLHGAGVEAGEAADLAEPAG